MKIEIDVLAILDEMHRFRRTHQDKNKDPTDYCMRVMEAILARSAGYEGRTSWTDELRNNSRSMYSKDLKENPALF